MEGSIIPENVVRLDDSNWKQAFHRLDGLGGGVIYVPSGIHEAEPVTIDLASYPNLRNNVTIRGAGIGTSIVSLGSGSGDGFALVDTDSSDLFYLEITDIQFTGRRDGVLFRLGCDDHSDAYNSCTFRFSTNNGHEDGTAACRLNHVLNSYHFGVHNANGGTGLELRQFQFGGITGSVRSNLDVSLSFEGYSMANVVEWLNVEACADGVRIAGDNANINRFGMLYGANVAGTLWRHDAAVRSRIESAFVGDNVAVVDDRTAGEYTVGLSNTAFTGARSQGYSP